MKSNAPMRPTETAEENGRMARVILAVVAALFSIQGYGQTVDDDAALVVRRSKTTGFATFLTPAPGSASLLPQSKNGREIRPIEVLAAHGDLFGITDPERQLVQSRRWTDGLGHTHTSFSQVHDGVPVMAGVLRVHQESSGLFVAANGDFFPVPERLGTAPGIEPDRAAAIAVRRVVARHPAVTRSRLVIVDPGWYGDPPRGPKLAYHVIVDDLRSGVSESILIDAHDGEVLDQWSLVYRDRERRIYDGEAAIELPGTLARSEGDSPVLPLWDQVARDINAAYDYAGDYHTFLHNAFGRDSIDDAGLPLVATVNSIAVTAGGGGRCPTAFFSTSLGQTVFCLGRVPDDVVGHEFTHGLTRFTSGLIYQNQSGALNESISFVLGESLDLINSGSEVAGVTDGPPSWADHGSGTGLDTNLVRTRCTYSPNHVDGVRWLYNEDRYLYEGAWYDMWRPDCMDHPDRANSPLYRCPLSNWGGTHHGAPIPNHAYALLTDGGTFNGVTLTGIGLAKAVAVWFRGYTFYLTAAADFEDAYWALNQAAADLVGTHVNDPRTGDPVAEPFTAEDAQQVDNALRAVEMNTPGRCGGTEEILDSRPAVECGAQQHIFSETFDSGLGGWTTSSSGLPSSDSWQVVGAEHPLPLGRQGHAAFCPTPYSPCTDDITGLFHLTSPIIDLPPGLVFPTLAFTHYVETELLWDGGNVRLSVDGGDWQLIPASAFYFNGYNQILADESASTSPLAGEQAFSGAGGKWATSLISLAGLVGDGSSIQLRFDLGRDQCTGATGWYLDDIRVYDCAESSDCNNNGMPDDVETAGGGHPDLVVHHEADHGNRFSSDADPVGVGATARAQRFFLFLPKTIHTIKIWGGYDPDGSPPAGGDEFTVIFHQADRETGVPGTVISVQSNVPAERAVTETVSFDLPEYVFTLMLPQPITFSPGTYWVEIFNDTTGDDASFYWITSGFSRPLLNVASATEAPGSDWTRDGTFNFSIEMFADFVGSDTDQNGVPDRCQNIRMRRPNARRAGSR